MTTLQQTTATTALLTSIVKMILTIVLTGTLALAGYFGKDMNDRLKGLESEKVRQAELHAAMDIKINMLLYATGYSPDQIKAALRAAQVNPPNAY